MAPAARRRSLIPFAAAAITVASPAAPGDGPNVLAGPNVITCALVRVDAGYRGTCSVPCSVNALAIDIDGPNPRTACAGPPRAVAAALGPAGPDGRRLGAMEGKFPEDPTRFEILPGRGGGDGVAKTPFGWFALRDRREDGDGLRLAIDANRQLPPTDEDIRILRRASELLSSDGAWDRADTRTCPADPEAWSLFCALRRATVEVTGGLHYRQPALQAVREAVDAVYAGRVSKHRLMEYNNDPAATLGAVRAVLAAARAELETRMRP